MAQYYKQEKKEPMSMFVPLPLEFLQGQMDKRQERLDVAKDLEAQAYDAFMSRQTTHPSDEQYKQEITNKQFQEMMDNINETYKGDAGSALNYMKSKIAETKQDPFWNALNTKEMMQKQEADFKEKHPAGSYFDFGSKTSEPVVTKDANGNTIIRQRPEDFAFDYVPRQDYGKIANEWMGTVQANLSEGALEEVDPYGLLRSTSIENLTETQLARVAEAKTPGFTGQTPEMYRALNEGQWDGVQRDENNMVTSVDVKNKNGAGTTPYTFEKPMTEAQAEQFLFLYNSGIEQVKQRIQKQYMANPEAMEARKRASDKKEDSNFNFRTSVVFNPTGPDDGPSGAYSKHTKAISDYEEERKAILKRTQNNFVEYEGKYYQPWTTKPTEAQANGKVFETVSQDFIDDKGNTVKRPVWIDLSNPTSVNEEDAANLSMVTYGAQKLKETNSIIYEKAKQLNPNLETYQVDMNDGKGEQTIIAPKNLDKEQRVIYFNTQKVLSEVSDLVPDFSVNSLVDFEDLDKFKGNMNQINDKVALILDRINAKDPTYDIKKLPPNTQANIMTSISNMSKCIEASKKAISNIENLRANAITPTGKFAEIPFNLIKAEVEAPTALYFNSKFKQSLADEGFKKAVDDATYSIYGSRTNEYGASLTFDETSTGRKPTESHVKISDAINQELSLPGRTIMDKSGTKISNYRDEFKGAKYNTTKFFWTPELGWLTEIIPTDKDGQPMSEEPFYYKTDYWGQLLESEDGKEAAALAMVEGLSSGLKTDGQNVKFKVGNKGYKVVRRGDDYVNKFEIYYKGKHKAYPSIFEAIYDGIGNGEVLK